MVDTQPPEKPSKAKIWFLEIRAPFLTASITPNWPLLESTARPGNGSVGAAWTRLPRRFSNSATGMPSIRSSSSTTASSRIDLGWTDSYRHTHGVLAYPGFAACGSTASTMPWLRVCAPPASRWSTMPSNRPIRMCHTITVHISDIIPNQCCKEPGVECKDR